MNITPKDFFPLIERGILAKEFLVAINGEWCRVATESVSDVGHYGDCYNKVVSITGLLISEIENDCIGQMETAVRISHEDIPCSIIDISCRNYRDDNQDLIKKEVRVQLTFRYDEYEYNFGDVTNTISDVPEYISHMLEVESNPKKKTFFDTIDLD